MGFFLSLRDLRWSLTVAQNAHALTASNSLVLLTSRAHLFGSCSFSPCSSFFLSFLLSFLLFFSFFLSFFLFFFVLGAGRGNNRSFTTQLLMNIPFQCTYLVTYEVTRRQLNPEGHYKPSAHLIAGGLAGATASAITTPMDVAKTYLNTQELCKGAQVSAELTHTSSRYVMGIVVAWKAIFTELGYSGFFRGITARVVAATPAAAISWSVYEFFKHSLVLVDGF